MKITTVRFDKKYSYGPYLNYDVGADATLDEGETEQEAWSKLEKMCDNYHQTNHLQNNPHLYQEQTLNDIVGFNLTGMVDYKEKMDAALYPKPEEKISQEQKILNLISQATSLPELQQWQILAKSKKELAGAYQQKLNELTNNL